MAVRGKVEVEVEVDLKSSADQFYSIFRNTPHHLPKICSDLHAGEIHEGEWKGDRRHSRRRFEFDDESKSVTHVGIGGDVFNYYKS
ncbi:hypothetical protein NL676_031978 [Syzygium grande]|nr:hypothetical protein NL676_031978 [Syzygium grande]